MYALIDCNNFFVSCEQVFNPKLRKKPLVVLSNNDGCIIARSQEVKAMGVKMGDPIFLYKDLIDAKVIHFLSSNFSLYSDMSKRVMQTLKTFGYPIEIYSVDEAFLHIDHPTEKLAFSIQEKVLRWTGIPTSVGIAPTKTLAKLAAEIGKIQSGVCCLTNPKSIEETLKKTSLEGIWGIGKRWAKKIYRLNVSTAWELTQLDEATIRKYLTIKGLAIVLELKGIPNQNILEEKVPRKSILCSRSFSTPLTALDTLYEAIAHFTTRALEKLRKEELYTSFGSVFLITKENYFQQSIAFAPTHSPLALISIMKNLTQKLYRENTKYKKAGVLFFDLSSTDARQLHMFQEQRQDTALMQTVDTINKKYKKRALYLAATGTQQQWKSKREYCSPQYTTKWDELLEISN